MSDRIPHLRGHRPRRWTGPGVVMLALGLLALTGCRDILTEPAPAGPASLAISVVMPEGTGAIPDFLARSEGPAATPGAAFDRADRVRIELRGSRGTRVDLDQAFRSEGALTRVRLELDLSEDEEMAIALELRYQGAPLFEAQGTARMTPGESTEAQLTLVGVVARIQVSEEPILLQALGDDFALSGQGVFASGQAVPGAVPTWESLNPQVARIVGGNRVQALSNGRTEVVARLGSLAESILVVVEQRVAIVELEPALLELDVLEVALLRVQLRDSNGNPIPPGNRVDWTTSDPRVAEVDADGRVRALAPGSAEVSALVDGVTGTAAVVVRELEPPEIVTQFLPDGQVGEGYNATLEASGGVTPYSWSLASGSLPAGLSLFSGGVISGTPSAAGNRTFTVRVTGSDGRSSTRSLSLQVTAPPPLGVGFGEEQFALIPAGTFQMGSGSVFTQERPVHTVTLTDPFYVQRTPVTQGQWREIMGSNPSGFNACGDTCPVERVSWSDAQQFIQLLNQRYPGRNYRLLTEAEWEYAARAGTTGDFGGTGVLDDMGWYDENSGARTHPVALKEPNAFGLFDMHGNVFEWVQDWFGPYTAEAKTNPTGPATGDRRVTRGGSWADVALLNRSAYRFGWLPTSRFDDQGFRLARTP